MAVKGQDFEMLAKKYSEGPSKDSGGYLGKFEKQSMVKPFGDQAFSMKPGEISKPVRTIFGWHIIKIINRFDATTQTLAQVSEKIKTDLELQEMQNLAYYKAGEAFDAVVDGDSFEQVALIANKQIVKTEAFNINGEGLEIADNSGFARAAFELPIGDISDVKQFGDSYYLIKVINKIDPVVQGLDLVHDKVVNGIKTKLQKDKAKEEAQLYLTRAIETKTLDQPGRDKNLIIKSTKLFTRTSNIEEIGNSPEFIKASFSLNDNNKIYPELIETAFGYCVIGFKEKKLPEASEISENLKTIKSEISSRKQAQSYREWISELRKQAKITYDPEMLN